MKTSERLWHAGRAAWAAVGILLLVAAVGYLASLVPLVVVPVILALFPATLLVPVARWLTERRVPAALAALATIVATLVVLLGVIGAMIPLVANELPEVAESAGDGLAELDELLQQVAPGVQIGGVQELLELLQDQVGELGDVAAEALSAALAAAETVAGMLLLLVVLFFYLKDGRRLAEGLVALAPTSAQARVLETAERAWGTLGAYFRGQLLVALVDAVVIGIGLVILGIPMAVPLALLIFFGGLFPIVGAVVTGALAVLVALADGGLTTGLIVAGLVLAVQQLEGNVLEPLILGKSVDLHPLIILLAITAGGILLGVLGAFLAVPAAAVVNTTVTHLWGAESPSEEGGDPTPMDPA